MTTKQYIKRMNKHEESFNKIWRKIVDDTNAFIKENPETTMYSFGNNIAILYNIEKFSDSMCLSGAWIQDRINGKMPTDRGSLTKKIRKALGYTYA